MKMQWLISLSSNLVFLWYEYGCWVKIVVRFKLSHMSMGQYNKQLQEDGGRPFLLEIFLKFSIHDASLAQFDYSEPETSLLNPTVFLQSSPTVNANPSSLCIHCGTTLQ